MAASCSTNEYGFDVTFVWEGDDKKSEGQIPQNTKEVDRDDITCAICLFVLKEPVQALKCGHRFCQKCIGKFHLKNPGKCPKDWQDIQVFEDVGKKREILNLKIRCQNFAAGCPWQNELREHKEHLKDCGYQAVLCHLECGEFILRKNVTNHLETICPMVVPYCSYHEVGCEFKGTKSLLDNHMAQSANRHVSLEIKYEVQKISNEFDEKLIGKDLQIQQLKSQLEENGRETNKVRNEFHKLLKGKDKDIKALFEKLRDTDKKVDDIDVCVKAIQKATKSSGRELNKVTDQTKINQQHQTTHRQRADHFKEAGSLFKW